MSAWRKLAEALGIETEAGMNYQKLGRQRNIQRYGTQDRRDPQSPLHYFNTRGTGAAQRGQAQQQQAPDMTPRAGGLQIPGGTDRPGQGNPLFAPPPRKAASPLSTAPNSPQGLEQGPEEPDQDWLDSLAGNDPRNR